MSEFTCLCGRTFFSAANNYRGRCPYCHSGAERMDGMSRSQLWRKEKWEREQMEEEDASDSD